MDIPPVADDFSMRRLCPDGACTGIIGPDGRCTECGMYAGPEDTETLAAGDAQAASTQQDRDDQKKNPAPATSLAGTSSVKVDVSNPGQDEDEDEFSRRRLCPDGACTGIIGPDGRCTECGRRFEA